MQDTDNSIFVGDKPFMNYVTGIVMQFTTKEAQSVVVKARGKYISRAVDVALAATERYLYGKAIIEKISVDSEEIANKEGRDVHVSIIEITLRRT